MGKVVGLIFEEREKLPCPVCGKEYTKEADLNKHIKKEHPEYSPDNQ